MKNGIRELSVFQRGLIESETPPRGMAIGLPCPGKQKSRRRD